MNSFQFEAVEEIILCSINWYMDKNNLRIKCLVKYDLNLRINNYLNSRCLKVNAVVSYSMVYNNLFKEKYFLCTRMNSVILCFVVFYFTLVTCDNSSTVGKHNETALGVEENNENFDLR